MGPPLWWLFKGATSAPFFLPARMAGMPKTHDYKDVGGRATQGSFRSTEVMQIIKYAEILCLTDNILQ